MFGGVFDSDSIYKKIAGIEIWNRPVYIKAVLGFIDSVSEAHKEIDYARYSKMRFVIGEALMRRIKNAYPGENGKIEVELYASETCFEVSIKDKGVPAWSDLFNKEAVDTDERKFKDFILNSWMDEVGMDMDCSRNGYLLRLVANARHNARYGIL